MAVQALARSMHKSEIDRAKKKQEIQMIIMTESFTESFKCRAETLNFLKPTKFDFPLGACKLLIEPTPNARVYVSVEGQMGRVSFLNGG